MKLDRLFKVTAVGLGYLGTLIPWTPVMADQPASRPAAQAASTKATARTVVDVRLTADGTLRGTLKDAKQQPVSRAVVSVRTALRGEARREVARVAATETGNFEITGLKPGVYYLVGGTGHGIYRVWTAETAPPGALDQIQMVSDLSLVRAQGPDGQNGQQPPGGQILYDQNGTAYGQVRIVDTGGLQPVGPGAGFVGAGNGGFLSSVGVFDAALLGVGIAGVTVGIIGLNEANDANDKIDAISNSP